MSFDGLFTRAMVKELIDTLKGGRIQKFISLIKMKLF